MKKKGQTAVVAAGEPKENRIKTKSKKKKKNAMKNDKKDNNQNQLIKNYKVNYGYLVFHVATLAANGVSVAWTTGGNN